MITISNYFAETDKIGIPRLPDTLRKSHEFVLKSTNNGDSWNIYSTNETIRKVIDLYLLKLNEYVGSQAKSQQPERTTTSSTHIKPKKELKQNRKPVKASSNTKSKNRKAGKLVEHIREEVKFIKRFVGLHNKVKSPNAILSFVKSLQKSIVQKLIRKTSPLAKEIRYIQDHLIDAYNKMKGDTKFSINEKELVKLVVISGGEEVYPSINIIKRYIGMQGKEIDGNKIGLFLKAIESALKRDKVKEGDPYQDKVKAILNSLKKLKTGQKPSIGKAELNGLEGIVKACGCKTDLGKIYDTKGKTLRRCKKKTYSDARKGACSHHKGLNGILTAEEIATREFELLNFNYRWSSLLGKPAKNFKMMVHGEPGGGKTTFLLKFAQYLSENFGKVLYVSSEEFAATTLTKKVNELFNPLPPNLHFVERVKDLNLSEYSFVILDSVNDLDLSITDFKVLKEQYPDIGFILTLQHTKNGQFRGGKEWEHEVEIAGEIENGIATIYKNRYGVKGTLDFFNNL